MAIIKRQNITSSVEDVEKWEHLYTINEEYKFVQSFENTIEVSQKLKERPYNPTVVISGCIYSKEMKSVSCRDILKWMFIVVLFTIAKIWENLSVTDGWMDREKRCFMTSLLREDINKISQTQKDHCTPSQFIFRIIKKKKGHTNRGREYNVDQGLW